MTKEELLNGAKPAIFKFHMVIKIIEGKKTQFRQPIGQPKDKCPYEIGDILYLKEAFSIRKEIHSHTPVWYRVNFLDMTSNDCIKQGMSEWKSPMFCPKKYARYVLKITNNEVELIKNINEKGLILEGMNPLSKREDSRKLFKKSWDSSHKKRGYPFCDNPLVWVFDFEIIKLEGS